MHAVAVVIAEASLFTGALVIMVLWLGQGAAIGQSPTGPGKANTAAAADTASLPRTPWGDPDLQGIWSPGYYLTPLERPIEYAGRQFLTDDEVIALEKEQAENRGRDTRLDPGSREDLEGAYNDVFSGRGIKVIRT